MVDVPDRKEEKNMFHQVTPRVFNLKSINYFYIFLLSSIELWFI